MSPELLETLHSVVLVALSAFLTALTIAVPLLIRQLTSWMRETLGIRLDEADERSIEALLQEAICYADEQAHKAAKAGEHPPAGGEKLRVAAAHFRTRAGALASRMDEAEVSDRIEAVLGERSERHDGTRVVSGRPDSTIVPTKRPI